MPQISKYKVLQSLPNYPKGSIIESYDPIFKYFAFSDAQAGITLDLRNRDLFEPYEDWREVYLNRLERADLAFRLINHNLPQSEIEGKSIEELILLAEKHKIDLNEKIVVWEWQK